jgi:hypothetical protein
LVACAELVGRDHKSPFVLKDLKGSPLEVASRYLKGAAVAGVTTDAVWNYLRDMQTLRNPDVQFSPCCKASLRNIPRHEMKSKAYKRRDGTVSEDTHTYECVECKKRFEINQDQ